MKRRDFIKQATTACLLMSAPWLVGCRATSYLEVAESDGLIKIPKTQFGEHQRKNLIVRSSSSPFPILLALREGNYTASLLRCPHQGAKLNVSGDLISCPAHGSEFSWNGKLMQGPAERDLEKLSVTLEGENIVIHLT